MLIIKNTQLITLIKKSDFETLDLFKLKLT